MLDLSFSASQNTKIPANERQKNAIVQRNAFTATDMNPSLGSEWTRGRISAKRGANVASDQFYAAHRAACAYFAAFTRL
jgi:hypothetical protein